MISPSFVENLRFLSLPSEVLGLDWFDLSLQIDQTLDSLKMDLADESIYLIYRNLTQSSILDDCSCRVARSVVGPKLELEGPLLCEDVVSGPVLQYQVSNSPLREILDHALHEAQTHEKNTIFIRVKRQLTGLELSTGIEVLIH